MDKPAIAFDWGVSDRFGWGVYGLNLLTYGPQFYSGSVAPLSVPKGEFTSNLFQHRKIQEYLSRILPLKLSKDDVFLSALGNIPAKPRLSGAKNVGVIFFEDTHLTRERLESLSCFDFIICGSSWNKNFLVDRGFKAECVIQGINPNLFRPLPKQFFRNNFVIFSGGKLEYRKGQDIVVKAMSHLMQRYPEILFVTAWGSPWQATLMSSVNQSNLCKPINASLPFDQAVSAWTTENGLPAHRVIHLPSIPNAQMPMVYSEVDLAVFPNRCEGGTNLVAMEALSAGVPSLLSSNTGHLDLLSIKGLAHPLLEGMRLEGESTLDWTESSVEEVIASVEEKMSQSKEGCSDKLHNLISRFTWESAIKKLVQTITSNYFGVKNGFSDN